MEWLGLSLLLICAGLPVSAETLTGKVVGFHDGDALILLVVGNQTGQGAAGGH